MEKAMNRKQATTTIDTQGLPKHLNQSQIWKIVIGVIKSVALLATGAGATFATMTNYVSLKTETIIQNRMAPYEELSTGFSQLQTNNWEDAAKTFKEALSLAKYSKLPQNRLVIFYDNMLRTISNCESWEPYGPEFEEYLTLYGKTIPESGLRSQWIAWFYINSGRAKEAQRHLSRSIQLFDSNNEFNLAADSVKGFAFVSLAFGDLKTASKDYKDYYKRLPVENEKISITLETKRWKAEKWYQRYCGYYGSQFDKTVTLLPGTFK